MCDLAATGIDPTLWILLALAVLAVGAALVVRGARARVAVLGILLLVGTGSLVATPQPASAADCPAAAPEVPVVPPAEPVVPPVVPPVTTTTLSVSPANWSAGSTANTQVFTVTNSGSLATTNLSVTLSGSSTFSVTSTTCPSALVPASSCAIEVSFTRQGTFSPVSAAVTISADNANTVTATMDGIDGQVATIVATPDPLIVQRSAGASTLTVINTSAAAAFNVTALISEPTIIIDSSNCAVLPPGGACTIAFTAFAGTTNGTYPVQVVGSNTLAVAITMQVIDPI